MDKEKYNTWYFLPYQTFSGSFNMALDYVLAENYNKLLNKPLLRFYGWNPYCLSLGIHQKLEEVDFQKCQELGIDVVRRPTGGRAVLHSEELTYAVIVPPEYMNLHQVYEFMHIVFSSTLQKLNVPAVLEENKPDLREFYKKKHSNLCFASAAQTEVKVKNKKLIGSAQHLFRDAILQHGSILIDSYHRNIVHLFKLNEKEQQQFLKILDKSTSEIHQYNPLIDAKGLSEKIQEELSSNKIEFIPFQLTDKILDQVRAMEREFKIEEEINNVE